MFDEIRKELLIRIRFNQKKEGNSNTYEKVKGKMFECLKCANNFFIIGNTKTFCPRCGVGA
tara:strand:+ start:293 stop:475 length:183 start_codon:yes stop_codon:yes gene_type:complete